ncbi:MAG: hypothetical protein OEY56_06500 [Cyclobacteriaceae bacterium]|nr:hypothetical protein [Cyclobacteriaceae bacterium]
MDSLDGGPYGGLARTARVQAVNGRTVPLLILFRGVRPLVMG